MTLPSYPKYKPSGIEWLGDVPRHWELGRLRYLLASPLKYGANEAAERDDPDLPRYVRITDIDESGNLRDETFKSLPNDLAAEYLLRVGDILFARSGATAGKTFLYSETWGPCAYAGYLIRARLDRRKGLPAFVRYFTASSSYWQWLSSTFIQATIQNVSAERYANLWVPQPSPVEQRAIADFLDRETSRLDTLVTKKRTLIERLKEKRTALISRTVTRGLPPDAARAASLDPHPKLKPTGIDWLGEVPEHWDVIPIGRKIVLQRGCDITKDQQQDGGVPVVSSGGVSSFHDEAVVQAPGVVVGRKGTAGAVYYIAFDFWPHDTTLYVSEFFENDVRYAYFKLLSMDLASFDTGSANPTVNRNLVHAVIVSWPPVVEQRAIAEFLDREIVRLDTLVTKIETAIERLQEHRTALITAAVTGKIDVRGTVVREEDAA